MTTSSWVLILLAASGGVMIALQPPINAALGTATGVLESAFISFVVGSAALGAVIWAAGRGQIGAVWNAPAWQLTGGLLGAYFVTVALYCAPRIGMTPFIVAMVSGQMLGAMLVDHFGLLGMPQRPVRGADLAGAIILVAAVWIITRNR